MSLDLLKSALLNLGPLPEAEWMRLAGLLGGRNLPAGELYVKAGEAPREIGFIVRGLVRRFYVTIEGRELIKGFSSEGQFVAPYSSLLTGEPTRLFFETLEPTELLVFNYDEFLPFYDRHVCWQRIGRRLAERFYAEREQREAQLLTLSAAERLAAFLENHAGLLPRIRQAHLASYLGITPVSLSRLRGRLRSSE